MRKLHQFFGLNVLVWIMCPLTTSAQAPKNYTVQQAQEAIVIDGEADDAWTNIPWTDDFIDIEGEQIPKYATRVKMLWDQEYLYFLAELEEPHIWGDITSRDAIIFYNNDFEIFMDPDGDTHNYMEFEINALNTVWDLWLTKPYRNHPQIIDGWDIKGMKTAVKINGTLNDSRDTDTSWTVEIAMPWAALKEAAIQERVPAGRFWRINFSRVNWDHDLTNGVYSRKKGADGKYLPEYNWVWSPQQVINMHEPERWGYVYFATKDSPATYEPDLNEQIKWQLYACYRKIRQQADKGEKIPKQTIRVAGQELPVTFERHLSGWNLAVKSPKSGELLLIKENSEFVIK